MHNLIYSTGTVSFEVNNWIKKRSEREKESGLFQLFMTFTRYSDTWFLQINLSLKIDRHDEHQSFGLCGASSIREECRLHHTNWQLNQEEKKIHNNWSGLKAVSIILINCWILRYQS